MSDDFYCVKALVAVGMNGDMVILTVSREAKDLLQDAQRLPATLALHSSSVPLVPGLYEFNGSTCGDLLQTCAPTMLQTMQQRGQFELVSSYAMA